MKTNARKMHFDRARGGGGGIKVGVYLEAGEKRWSEREREIEVKRVHHRSVVAGFNQLLTPCRLAAEPTNDAMMAVSFSPRTAPPPTSGNDGGRGKRQRRGEVRR